MFHAQQCVEKYLKASLTLKGIDFPKTYDISELLVLIPVRLRPQIDVKEQRVLTSYATVTRYPGDYEPISLAEAKHAVSVARKIRKQLRSFLLKEAIQKKKI